MNRSSIVAGAAAMAGAAAFVAIWLTTPDQRQGPCSLRVAPTSMPGVTESSGLAVSRRQRGVLWTHNDSGNAAVLFALDTSGRILGQVRVPVRTRDWEDVSAAACPAGGDCLYVADIGDNRQARQTIEIYRVPEPAPGDPETREAQAFHATYADGPHNAEAMFVVGATAFVVTRDRTGGVYRAVLPATGGGALVFQRVGQLGLGAVTDAEAFDDGRAVVVRTSHDAVFYRFDDLNRGNMSPYFRVSLDGLREPQGEGVAVDGDMLYLTSEGRRWSRGGWFMSLACRLPATAPAETPPGPPSRPPSGGD